MEPTQLMFHNDHPQIAGGIKTSDPVTATANAVQPEFIRLPRSGTRDAITGLSRSTLNGLILPSDGNGFKPPVKSVCLRKRGAARGTRLIVLESLLAFLHGQSQNQSN